VDGLIVRGRSRMPSCCRLRGGLRRGSNGLSFVGGLFRAQLLVVALIVLRPFPSADAFPERLVNLASRRVRGIRILLSRSSGDADVSCRPGTLARRPFVRKHRTCAHSQSDDNNSPGDRCATTPAAFASASKPQPSLKFRDMQDLLANVTGPDEAGAGRVSTAARRDDEGQRARGREGTPAEDARD
jgi:hypothetical protein